MQLIDTVLVPFCKRYKLPLPTVLELDDAVRISVGPVAFNARKFVPGEDPGRYERYLLPHLVTLQAEALSHKKS
jgi:hypothetical protein